MTIKVTYNVTDVYMSQSVSPVYINVSYSDGGASGGGVWGSITGTLSNQTDLQTALDLKVPYSGATGNVNLGEYELKAGQVTLDVSPTGTASVGTTRWNDTTGTSETTLKGGNVIIKNGVDLVARVVNKVTPNTTLTKAAYQAVRVSGAQGQRLAVALAQANNDTNSADTIGLVTETIATNQEGFIMTMGQLENINTTGSLQGENWVDGDVLYLSPTTAGAITNVQPTGSGHIVVIGYVEYAHANNGKIFVKVLNGWELTELHDTEIVNPLNNEGLFYESSTALWKNKSISTVLGYTPEQPLTFNSPLSRAGNVISIPQATGSVNGFLSATDWTTFNSKENALTFSSPLVRTTNAISIPQATGSVSGFLSSTDWTTFNSKQAALGFTPANAATTLTINGVTFDLSANRTWTIAAGISGSGAAGQVTYWTGTSAVSGSNNLFWDNANGRLGIGTNAPANDLTVSKTVDGIVRITTTNLSTGTNAFSGFVASNSAGALVLQISGTGNTIVTPNQGRLTTGSAITNGLTIETSTTTAPITIGTNNTIGMTMFGSTRNVVFQNGGTFTDGGQRLQVYGDTLLRGSGATSATTALTVQNSSSTNLFTVRNDGNVGIGTASPTKLLQVNLPTGVNTLNNGIVLSRGAGSGTFVLGNATSNTNDFVPSIYSKSSVDNAGFYFGASVFGTSSTFPAMEFQAANSTNTGAIGATQTAVRFANWTTNLMEIRGNGTVIMASLPTSSAGLPSGALWNNGGVINIV